MIAYLTLAIAVCTIVLVLFMSFDVLRNRSVVDKTREDIDMIKKNIKELKHPVAYTMENYVIIPKSHLDEYNNTCTRVEIQAKGIHSPVTSVLPLLDMIKSGKEIAVEGDNLVAGKVKDYIINLKENLDILEDIKEMVGKEPETVILVNFMNKATLEGHVLKLDCNSVSHTPTIDKYFNERVNSSYFYNKMYFNPSSDVIDKMNEANEPMLKLKSNNGMINHFLKCDFMTVNENIDTYYFFYKDKVVATCSMKSYDDMAIAITPREWVTGINYVIDGELSMVALKYNGCFRLSCFKNGNSVYMHHDGSVMKGDLEDKKWIRINLPLYKFDNDEVDYSFFMVDIPGETIEGTMMADIIPTVFDKLSKVNPDILVEYYKKTINHPLSTNECIFELYIEK